MKKLLALLVIIMFTALIANAVDNPFSFSLYNQITLKAVDTSQPGRIPDNDSSIGNSPANDFNVAKANLNDDMKCSASITIAEIYTMGFFLQGTGEYGFNGDAMRTQFGTGMTNAIQVVPDYLKIDVNLTWNTRWESRQQDIMDGTIVSEADYAAYLDRIDPDNAPHTIDFDDNGTDNEAGVFDVVERDTGDSGDVGQHTNFLLTPMFKLSGGIPDSGFTWAISETVEMLWNPENWKDSDPTFKSYDGNEYDPATGDAIHGDEGAFEYADFQTNVTLEWEFFHYFAPENITCTLSLSHNLNVQLNYSYYLEKDKRLRNEGTYGVKFGLAGVNLGLFMYLRSDDFLNTSAPLDGDNGSNWSWDGKIWDPSGITDFTDMDATKHARPTMRIGPKITFGYSKEWFSFGTSWLGYEDNLRRWDEDGLNAEIMWQNEFEINVKFSL